MNKTRLKEVDFDFLEHELEFMSKEDKLLIDKLVKSGARGLENPNNSIALYVYGLTDIFDFKLARSKTIGGSPPDIDVDYSAVDRHKVIHWVIEKWGRDNVANIGTFGTLKPKSLIRAFYRIHGQSAEEALKMVPEPVHGKEATLDEVIEGNKEKGYKPHPELLTEEYKELYITAKKLEDLVSSNSVHAAGLLISDFNIFDKVPLRAEFKTEPNEKGLPRKTQQYITQFDMDEVQELGLLKYDFLSIDNLSIINETTKLLKEKGIELDVYKIPDFDKRTYDLLAQGFMAGIFQMEVSGVAKQLIASIKPQSIEDLSAISSIKVLVELKVGHMLEHPKA